MFRIAPFLWLLRTTKTCRYRFSIHLMCTIFIRDSWRNYSSNFHPPRLGTIYHLQLLRVEWLECVCDVQRRERGLASYLDRRQYAGNFAPHSRGKYAYQLDRDSAVLRTRNRGQSYTYIHSSRKLLCAKPSAADAGHRVYRKRDGLHSVGRNREGGTAGLPVYE